MNKKRYKEDYEEGSNLLWPSEKEDKVTRRFYENLSIISREIIYKKRRKNNLIKQIINIIFGKH